MYAQMACFLTPIFDDCVVRVQMACFPRKHLPRPINFKCPWVLTWDTTVQRTIYSLLTTQPQICKFRKPLASIFDPNLHS